MKNIYLCRFMRITTAVVFAAALMGLQSCATLPQQLPEKEFSIIVLPDTQHYSLRYPETFISQTQWIRKQADMLNIACVIHEGDITGGNTEKEWENADRAMSILDGVVPYFMVMGNHDYVGDGGTAKRNSVNFNKYFGIWRYEKKPWYGGHFGEGSENAFYTFRAGGMDFLVVCLEFGPRDEVLEWANRVVEKHGHYRTIVVTHCYTYSDDTRVGPEDKWNPHVYKCDNDGEEIWNKFVRKHKNVFLVLSGHILNDGLGRLKSTGDHGNMVHEILANYQMQKNGGSGWLRIMKFLPSENKIAVTTYSPLLDEYAEDADNCFELEYPMK